MSGEAASACEEYLDRLRLRPEVRRLALERAGAETDPARALATLHRVLSAGLLEEAAADGGAGAAGAAPALGSVERRLQLGWPSATAEARACPSAGRGCARLPTAPPLCRTSIAPSAWPSPLSVRVWRTIARLFEGGLGELRRAAPRPRSAPQAHPAASRSPGLRRALLSALVIGQTAAAAYAMTVVLPHRGSQPLELAILALFTILFGWVSLGFWTGVVGFVISLGRQDPHSITRSLAKVREISPDARTAIVMPICNEHVPRVFAGLRASYASLARTGALDRFDFFVLSDSSDPDARVAETRAWLDLCQAVGGFGRIFYRWRRHRIKRKSGNIADFCRRWGRRYRYMVVLDADSVMSGSCLTTLVRLMEANPTTGIIQTAPRPAGRETLYARLQQFATRVYGPVFTAGLNFWHLGDSYYWGHNAIIRLDPFMRHCALGRLPGRGALSGEILSHDFVEAALMRRAGWDVWVAHDVPGSYEELPPNLIQESGRDRRWCQGNLINSRLFWAEGFRPAHRAVFMAGVMAYLSGPLWLASLALSTALIVIQTVFGPRYFEQPWQLFPVWPEWHAEWAIGLAIATASALFAPKLLSAALVLRGGAREFGGPTRFVQSVLLELAFSALLAPIRMLFHSKFILAALTGWRTSWRSPSREDAETSWGEALRRHGGHTALGIAWALGVYRLAPGFVWWLLPTAGALAISIPLSVYSSRVSLGRRFRRAGLLLIPEETRTPLELRTVRRCAHRATSPARFVDAVIDPVLNAVACAAAPCRASPAPALRAARARLVAAAAREGPAALTRRERMVLLSDPMALSRLHLEVWASPAARAKWRADEPSAAAA